ncbi:MAG: penicillin-binding protein [Chloroflexia bacterium]
MTDDLAAPRQRARVARAAQSTGRVRRRSAGYRAYPTEPGARPLFVVRRRTRLRRAPIVNRGANLRRVLAGFVGSALLLFLLVLGGLGMSGWWAWNYYTTGLPTLDSLQVNNADQFQSSKIYDRKGRLLYEISDPHLGKRTYLSIDQLPPDLINATIAAEDPTFRENSGIDWRGLVRAAYINISGKGTSGASTITMQLVRRVMLPEHDAPTISRKIREAILANQLGQVYSKDRILETYLNDIYYGSLAYGAPAAAEVYYGVAAKDLDLAQSAMLAGLPQAPSDYDPHVNYASAKLRQGYVLRQMVRYGFVTQGEADKAAAEDVHPALPTSASGTPLAPHFVDYVRAILDDRYGTAMVNRGGLKVITTLDLDYQDLAQRVASEQVAALKADNATNAALTAINPRTGEILAMLGSVDYTNPNFGQVNVAVSPRQPGSSFKPFTYVTAFKEGYTPASMLADIPTKFDAGPNQPPYEPKDYDLKYRGPVLVRQALANSLNIPAVSMLQKAGVPKVLATAHDMGITTLQGDPSQYGLALTLGGGEVTLLDMTSAYGTFADRGVHMPPQAILEVRDGRNNLLFKYDPDKAQANRAITPQQAYLITNILSDNAARTPIFGANSALKLSRQAAAKTGTTEDYRDSWTLGYTPNLVVGVWVGNDDDRPMSKVAGSRGAGPIWHNFMEGVFAGPNLEADLKLPSEAAPPTTFEEPPGMVRAQVCATSGLKPNEADTDIITELFIAGTEPQQVCNLHKLFNVCIVHKTPELANADCPPQSVIQRPYLVLPAEFDAWAATQPKLLVPPRAVCCFPTPTPAVTPTPEITDTPIPGLAPPIDIPYPTPRPPDPENNAFPGAVAVITAPRPGPAVNGAVVIVGSAAADDFDHYMLDYSPDVGIHVWSPVGNPVTAPAHNEILGGLNTDPIAEGSYILRLTVVGTAGETRQYTVPIRVERSKPTVSLLTPLDGSPYYAGETVTMNADASGPLGVAGVEFYVDDLRLAVVYNPPYQATWTATAGEHTLAVVAYSAAGQHTSSAPVSITVADYPTALPTPPPSFAIVSPQNQSQFSGPSLAVVVAAGPDAAVARVDFYVDGWNVASVQGHDSFQMNWQTIPGKHTIMAIGYDAAGGEVARSRITVSSH